MLKKLRFNLLAALSFCVLLLSACSDDGSSSSGSKGVARYTAIIYGQNGGDMEESIEGTMHDIKDIIGDEDDVRVLLVYKYGKGGKSFSGKLAYPGQLLYFEITKDTDLSKLKDSLAIVKDSIKFYDPEYLTSVINYAHDSLPAQEYLFFLEAHGEGFDFYDDYPKSMRNGLAKQAVKAVMQDEWVVSNFVEEAMTMNEFAEGIKNSKIPHFKAILFHNCLMGNMESLAEIYSYADYIMVSEHSLLTGRGELMTEIVEDLTKNADGEFEDVVKSAFEDKDVISSWKIGYVTRNYNGDFQFLRAAHIADLNPIFKKLSTRLIELYADEGMRRAIDKAADRTYKINEGGLLYDARDYANKLAEETKDETLKKIAKELDAALDSMTITRSMEAHYAKDAPLDHFGLSVVLISQDMYNENMLFFKAKNSESYELTTFHKETGWGDWLNTNTHTPKGNPFGQSM